MKSKYCFIFKQEFEKRSGIKVMQTSAKLSYQVEAGFNHLIDILMKRGLY
jgi:hypothetical protein